MAPIYDRKTITANLPSILLLISLLCCIWSPSAVKDRRYTGVFVVGFSPLAREIISPRLRSPYHMTTEAAPRMSTADGIGGSALLSTKAASVTGESEHATKSTTSATGPASLLRRRLRETYGVALAEAFVVDDSHCRDEEKKEEPIDEVVEIKTLVWEVDAIADRRDGDCAEARPAALTFYVVTALRMDDKIEMRKLKDLVLEKNGLKRPLRSIRSMQLAPLNVAESLTGYRSGCMPPICHTDENMDLYVDQSIVDAHERHSDAASFASIGSGTPGKSVLLPLPQFLRVAGLDSDVPDAERNAKRPGFVGSIVSATPLPTSEAAAYVHIADEGEQIVNKQQSEPNSKDAKMASGVKVRKLKQKGPRQQRETRKDRLKEYRSFKKDDILSKAQLFRSTARKKGRIAEMEELIQEALAVGDFPKLMEVPDEQNPSTDISKNALHICAWRGDFETVVRLIETSTEHFPELNVVNVVSKGPGNYGKTPIFYALTQCREDVVRYLVREAGADLLIVNNKGQTPCSIAPTHMSEETCRLMYETEAKQLAARSRVRDAGDDLFANYRASVHSDRKLYGDLDPRFPIDDHNRYFSEEEYTRRKNDPKKYMYDPKNVLDSYMDGADDLSHQIKAFEESVRAAPAESVIAGIPTQFSPRSLRPTVRWWNREDQSLTAANNDTSLGGQITFTQSRPRNGKKHRAREEEEMKAKKMKDKNKDMDECDVSTFSHVEIDSLEPISIDDIMGASSDDRSASFGSRTVLVWDSHSLTCFQEEVDRWLSELNQDLEHGDENKEVTLLKHAWGIDCEWKPGPGCGEGSPVSTLQLSTSRKAFLIDLQTICEKDGIGKGDLAEGNLNRALFKLFRNRNAFLVGFGVLQDLERLAASFPHLDCFLEFASVIDLQSLSSVVYNNKFDRKAMSSLQKMTATLLNKRLDKTQQVSNWSHRPLSEEQISYALLDAAIIPVLLAALTVKNELILGCNKNVVSTIRFVPIEPCGDGYVYQITHGSIKSVLGKALARQRWPATQEAPEPPKLVPTEQNLDWDLGQP